MHLLKTSLLLSVHRVNFLPPLVSLVTPSPPLPFDEKLADVTTWSFSPVPIPSPSIYTCSIN